MKQLKWTTISQYVDYQTGEVLTKQDAKLYYEIINKTKHYEVNEQTQRGIATITNECRPKQQTDLFRHT